MTLAWTVGGGGLLGSQVVFPRSGGFPEIRQWTQPGPVPWENPPAARTRLDSFARSFLAQAVMDGTSWAVLWCAGAGVVGTSPQALATEIETFSQFLTSVGSAVGDRSADLPGFLILASSAGGIYGGCSDRPITEQSPVHPISPYGHAKLAIEQSLLQWASGRDVSTLVARISNLYGPGQKLNKPQGLISHIARKLIYHQPIHIYVPLDTTRDYLYAGDAGRWIAAWTCRLVAERTARQAALRVEKICAAEEDTTISTLISVFRRIAKRQLKLIHGIQPLTRQQPLKLQFRSQIWPGLIKGMPRTLLLDGVARVYRHQLQLFTRGQLRP